MSKLLEALKKLENDKQEKIPFNSWKNKQKEKNTKKVFIISGIILAIALLLGIVTLIITEKAKQKKLQIATTKITEKNNIPKKGKLTIKEEISTKRKDKTNIQKTTKETPMKEQQKQIQERQFHEILAHKKTASKKSNSPKSQNSKKHKNTENNQTKEIKNKKTKDKKDKQIEIKTNFTKINSYLIIAEEARKKGRYKEAIFYYQRILKNPNISPKKRASILNNLGTIYLILGKYYKAKQKLEKAYKINPNETIAKNLVICYLRLKEKGKACSIINEKASQKEFWQKLKKDLCLE